MENFAFSNANVETFHCMFGTMRIRCREIERDEKEASLLENHCVLSVNETQIYIFICITHTEWNWQQQSMVWCTFYFWMWRLIVRTKEHARWIEIAWGSLLEFMMCDKTKLCSPKTSFGFSVGGGCWSLCMIAHKHISIRFEGGHKKINERIIKS